MRRSDCFDPQPVSKVVENIIVQNYTHRVLNLQSTIHLFLKYSLGRSRYNISKMVIILLLIVQMVNEHSKMFKLQNHNNIFHTV